MLARVPPLVFHLRYYVCLHESQFVGSQILVADEI
jgi:hypothetical protein